MAQSPDMERRTHMQGMLNRVQDEVAGLCTTITRLEAENDALRTADADRLFQLRDAAIDALKQARALARHVQATYCGRDDKKFETNMAATLIEQVRALIPEGD